MQHRVTHAFRLTNLDDESVGKKYQATYFAVSNQYDYLVARDMNSFVVAPLSAFLAQPALSEELSSAPSALASFEFIRRFPCEGINSLALSSCETILALVVGEKVLFHHVADLLKANGSPAPWCEYTPKNYPQHIVALGDQHFLIHSLHSRTCTVISLHNGKVEESTPHVLQNYISEGRHEPNPHDLE